MLYQSTEARMKSIAKIDELMAKLGGIPGNIMGYEDVRATRAFLEILRNEIVKEDKR